MPTPNIYPRLTDFPESVLLNVSQILKMTLEELPCVLTEEQKEDLIAFRIQVLTAARVVNENERIANN